MLHFHRRTRACLLEYFPLFILQLNIALFIARIRVAVARFPARRTFGGNHEVVRSSSCIPVNPAQYLELCIFTGRHSEQRLAYGVIAGDAGDPDGERIWTEPGIRAGGIQQSLGCCTPRSVECKLRPDFYMLKDSTAALLLEGRTHLLRLLQEIPLGEAEQAAVEDGVAAYENLLSKLSDVPTPAGPTPRQLGAGLVQITSVRPALPASPLTDSRSNGAGSREPD